MEKELEQQEVELSNDEILEIDCALPTPKELLSIIQEYFSEGA